MRFKGYVGAESVATREHSWFISKATETDCVVDGTKLLQVVDIMVKESPEWRYSRRDAARDVIKQLSAIKSSIEKQIEEIKLQEGIL
jgi:hypothetical protein